MRYNDAAGAADWSIILANLIAVSMKWQRNSVSLRTSPLYNCRLSYFFGQYRMRMLVTGCIYSVS